MKNYLSFLLAFFAIVTIVNAQAPNWQWAKSAGGVNDESGNGVATDASGNIYVVGSFGSASITFGSIVVNKAGYAGNIFVAKYNPSGTALWVKGFGGNTSGFCTALARGIALDASGNIYVTGYYAGTGMTFGTTVLPTADTNQFSSGDIFTVKLNPLGDVVWANSAGGPVNDAPYGITADAAGNVYVTGYFCSSVFKFGATTLNSSNNSGIATNDFFIAKYNTNGVLQWAKNTGGNGLDIGYGISADAAGNVLVCGYFSSTSISFGSIPLTPTAAANLFLVKYDGSGNAVWAKTGTASGSGSINHYANDVATDANNNVYITGIFSSALNLGGSVTLPSAGGSASGFYVAKYDASGTALWARNNTDASASSLGQTLTVDGAGNAYASGYFTGKAMAFGTDSIYNSNTAGNNEDVFVVKYNTTGTFQWAKSAGGIARELCNGVAADANGGATITGSLLSTNITFGSITVPNNTPGYSDFFIAKVGTASGLTEQHADAGVTTYPNPCNGQLTLKTDEAITGIEIMNMMGELITPATPIQNSNEINIDLSDQAKGIYLVHIVCADHSIIKKKIILQ